MSQAHPGEIELARLSEEESGADVAQHVSRCVRCRSVLADYRWLQGEIGATLATVADEVVVPRPRWWAVQTHILAGQRRVAGWRVSTVASVLLSVCLMLSLSPVLGMAVVAQTSPPEPVIAPAPVTVVVSGQVSGAPLASLATPTPAISCEGATAAPTPAFVLPPTPPMTYRSPELVRVLPAAPPTSWGVQHADPAKSRRAFDLYP